MQPVPRSVLSVCELICQLDWSLYPTVRPRFQMPIARATSAEILRHDLATQDSVHHWPWICCHPTGQTTLAHACQASPAAFMYSTYSALHSAVRALQDCSINPDLELPRSQMRPVSRPFQVTFQFQPISNKLAIYVNVQQYSALPTSPIFNRKYYKRSLVGGPLHSSQKANCI